MTIPLLLSKKDKRMVLEVTEEAFTELRKALSTFPEYSVSKELKRLVGLMEANGNITSKMY